MLNQLVRTKPDPFILAAQGTPPTVTPRLGYYTVVFPAYVRPGTHLVRKDRTCMCDLGKDCPAVQAVVAFLQKGGTRAPESRSLPVLSAANLYTTLLSRPISLKRYSSEFWVSRTSWSDSDFRTSAFSIPQVVFRMSKDRSPLTTSKKPARSGSSDDWDLICTRPLSAPVG